MTFREMYINAITDPAVRAWVYKEARRVLPDIGARCALTQYLFLWSAGVLQTRKPKPTFTTQLEHILITECRAKHFDDYGLLKRGDICFSQNRNGTPGPDHVYAFHTWIEQPLTALVIDNYAVGPHKRNVAAVAPKTRFDFALRLP